jgi:L-ascorbate metabolism protein UlaG (beta-lactamase superfamily)
LEITCIGHSGFLVELPEYNLIFDYFTDEKNIIIPELFTNKKTCVFVSHRHYDHFNKKIFNWNNSGNIIYILDEWCVTQKGENIIKVREGEDFNIFNGEINVKTYGSTDEGVSFLVTVGEIVIFHAGDLNDWYWEDESTLEELITDEGNYLRIIKKLAGQKINVAFIPEDPRLGHNAGRGIKYFNEIVAPDKIIPMHFPGNAGLKYINI